MPEKEEGNNIAHKEFRHRIKAEISTRGLITWDCSVEGVGFTREEVLSEHDQLVKELKVRYPVKVIQ